jgi:DNA repair exonuclease SbcCD ATPase subunit
MKLKELQNLYNQKLGKLEALTNSLQTCDARIKELEHLDEVTTKASLFLQSLSDSAREQVINKISGLVTELLQAVKDKNLEFRMILGVERNQADLKFKLIDKLTGTELDPLESAGGGIVDLIALGLRVALLVTWRPQQQKVLILDESLKHLGVQDQELGGEFIRTLSEKLGLQIIFVSHSKVLAEKAHKCFEVTKDANGISHVEEKANV